MTGPGRLAASSGALVTRRVLVRVRGGGMLEGAMHLADGASVVSFLDRRRSFLNLTSVRPMGEGTGAQLAVGTGAQVADGKGAQLAVGTGAQLADGKGAQVADGKEDGPANGGGLPHLGVRVSQIIWVEPLDGRLPLSLAQALTEEDGRRIELHLVDGLRLIVTLHISEELRLSDYFDERNAFIPLRGARLHGSEEEIDRLALNHSAILTIRELD